MFVKYPSYLTQMIHNIWIFFGIWGIFRGLQSSAPLTLSILDYRRGSEGKILQDPSLCLLIRNSFLSLLSDVFVVGFLQTLTRVSPRFRLIQFTYVVLRPMGAVLSFINHIRTMESEYRNRSEVRTPDQSLIEEERIQRSLQMEEEVNDQANAVCNRYGEELSHLNVLRREMHALLLFDRNKYLSFDRGLECISTGQRTEVLQLRCDHLQAGLKPVISSLEASRIQEKEMYDDLTRLGRIDSFLNIITLSSQLTVYQSICECAERDVLRIEDKIREYRQEIDKYHLSYLKDLSRIPDLVSTIWVHPHQTAV